MSTNKRVNRKSNDLAQRPQPDRGRDQVGQGDKLLNPDENGLLQQIEFMEKDVLERAFDNTVIFFFVRDGLGWFYVNEVCAALGFTDPSDALPRLTPDDIRAGIHVTADGRQKVIVVNEGGLYALIFSSRKPQAEAFRRWVASELLPALFPPHNQAMGTEIVLRQSQPPHMRMIPARFVLDEWTDLDTQIFACQMRTIDALWRKTQLVRSLGADPTGTLVWEQLKNAIAEGRRLADEYLRRPKIRPN